jgi:integrase
MPLTEIRIKSAKPQDKPYKLADGNGMFLLVHPNGSKYWRLKYRLANKEKLLALGVYPEVSLSDARDKRNNARKLLKEGRDPSQQKQIQKQQGILDAAATFEAVAREWHEKNIAKWTPDHGAKILRRLELNIFPVIGRFPVKEIKPSEVLAAIRKVESRNATELSHRILQNCVAVFRYAIANDNADYNPAADLQGALKSHKGKHYPALTAKDLPDFLTKLEEVETSPQNKLAIRLLLLTFVRQGEMRQANWEHVDWKAKEWRIPAENTKMRARHIVPLAKQTVSLLKQIKEITGDSPYLFPSQHRQKNPIMSENTVNVVLKRMGYKDQMVGHGFRALASTTLNEMGFKPDVIERQLAHAERNKVRAAYNRAEYLDERRDMMQKWADFVDAINSPKS